MQHKLSSVWNCGSVESGKILKHRNSLYAPNPTMGYGLHGTTQLRFLPSVDIDIKANLPWWGVVCFNNLAKSVKILKASSEGKWSRESFLESHLWYYNDTTWYYNVHLVRIKIWTFIHLRISAEHEFSQVKMHLYDRCERKVAWIWIRWSLKNP